MPRRGSRGTATTVNRIALPPARTCGQRWPPSPAAISTLVTPCGVPPAAGTRCSPPSAASANTITSSGPQLAPYAHRAAQIFVGAPPEIGTFQSALRDQNPTQRPSGEKNGAAACSVPAIAVAPAIQAPEPEPLLFAAKAGDMTWRLSGESAMALRVGGSDLPTALHAVGRDTSPVRCYTDARRRTGRAALAENHRTHTSRAPACAVAREAITGRYEAFDAPRLSRERHENRSSRRTRDEVSRVSRLH